MNIIFREGYIRLHIKQVSRDVCIQNEYWIIGWHPETKQWHRLYQFSNKLIAIKVFDELKQHREVDVNHFVTYWDEVVDDTAPNYTDVYVRVSS